MPSKLSTFHPRRKKMQISDKRPTSPWKPLRIGLRIVLLCALAWVVLVLFWVFLPSPPRIWNEKHASSILRSGEGLTRVYPSQYPWYSENSRENLEIKYKLHNPSSSSASLEVSGFTDRIPLLHSGLEDCNNETEITEFFDATIRTGYPSGATLPWFTLADSILLGWWIDGETTDTGLAARWGLTESSDSDYVPDPARPEVCRRRLEILRESDAIRRISEAGLLTIDIERIGREDRVNIVKIDIQEGSDSPTWTYPLRAAIIVVLAPTSIFLNDWVRPSFKSLVGVLVLGFLIFVYAFLIGAVVVSLWKCFGGPSLDATTERIRGWRGTGRFAWVRVDLLQDRIVKFLGYDRVQWVLRVCREGWHPERERERIAREQEDKDADVERGTGSVKIKIRT